MAISKREEELYHRDHEGEPVKINPQTPRKPLSEPLPAGKAWGKVEAEPQSPLALKPESRRRLWYFVIAAGIAFGLFAAGWYGVLRWWAEPSVTLGVEAPREVRAGEQSSFEIVIQNAARAGLEGASLTLRAGSGVLLADASGKPLGERVVRKDLDETIEPNSIRRETFSAYFLGKEGDSREIEISFRYRMPNIASDFAQTETISIQIAAPAVALNFNLPQQVLSARDFAFGYEWQNLSEFNLNFMTAELELPQDFTFTQAAPAPTQAAEWQFQELPPQGSGAITAIGRLNAPAGEVRVLRALLSTNVRGEKILLGEITDEILVIENPLLMAMSVNGQTDYSTLPGETLQYRITFRNNFQEGLRDIIIVAKLDGAMFDLASMETAGAFDSRNRTVTFHGGNTSQLLLLGPQESGSVTFAIRTRNDIPGGLRNPTISVSAEMTSATRPRHLGVEGPVSAATSIESKVSGVLTLTSNVLLRDPVYGRTVVGPWPLRVDQTTQMSVHLVLAAAANDFENILVSTTLPAGIAYIGNLRGNTAGTEMIVDPRTSRLEWRIPRLPAYQERNLIFQVGVTPSILNAGNPIEILRAVTLTGRDHFTARQIDLTVPAINSTTLRDPTIANPSVEGRVSP